MHTGRAQVQRGAHSPLEDTSWGLNKIREEAYKEQILQGEIVYFYTNVLV